MTPEKVSKIVSEIQQKLRDLPPLCTKLAEIKWPEVIGEDQREAINIASKYDLDHEVAYAMFNLGMSPKEALQEWDILES